MINIIKTIGFLLLFLLGVFFVWQIFFKGDVDVTSNLDAEKKLEVVDTTPDEVGLDPGTYLIDEDGRVIEAQLSNARIRQYCKAKHGSGLSKRKRTARQACKESFKA